MAAAIPWIIAAASAVSAIGSIRQAQAASQISQQQATVSEVAGNFNATINEQNVEIVRQDARDQAKQSERETYLRLGAIRAAQGKSGGYGGEGSVLDVLGDVAAQSELEKQNIIYQGELKARGYTNTATLDRFGGGAAASRYRAQGEAQEMAGYSRAGSELLQGGSSAYSAYKRIN